MWTEEDCPHFITSVTHERQSIFVDADTASLLMEELHFYAQKKEVDLICACVMPDHFHCVIWPKGKYTFSDYMHGVKGYFTRVYADLLIGRGLLAPPMNEGILAPPVNELINRRGSYAPPMDQETPTPKSIRVWQESFFDYLIQTDEKLEEKVEYTLMNPVEEGLVRCWQDYPFTYIHPEYRAIFD